MKSIILASKSPRRISILQEVGVSLIIHPADIDEDNVVCDNIPSLTKLLAENKAKAVTAELGDDSPIIAADTLVEYNNKKLGKPKNKEDAFNMLKSLSNTRHYVHTGVAVSYRGKIVTHVNTSEVYFKELSDSEITRYVESGEPMDKAGAYGIQEKGRMFVKKINGDYFNIMGLPICDLEILINREFGISLYDFCN